MSLTPHGYRADPPSPSPSFAQTGAELDLESDLEFDYDIEQDAHDQRQQYLNSNSNSHSNPSGHRRRGITDSDSDDNDEYDDYDEEDDDDLRSEVFGGEGSYDAEEEAYEMRDRNTSSDRAGGSRWHQPPKREKTQGSSLRRLSATSVASFQLYTPDEEQTVRRKFDRRLVLFVAMLYMLSFLDRSSTSVHTIYPVLGLNSDYFISSCILKNVGAYICSINKLTKWGFFSCRYWKRPHRRHGRRPPNRPTQRSLVLLGPHSILHLLHRFRVDVPPLAPHPRPHLHLHTRPLLGHHRLPPSRRSFIPGPYRSPCCARYRGGWFHRYSLLSEFLL